MTPNRQEKAGFQLEKLDIGSTRLDAASRKRYQSKQDISDLDAQFLTDGEGSWRSPNGNSGYFWPISVGVLRSKNLTSSSGSFKNHSQTLALPVAKRKI